MSEKQRPRSMEQNRPDNSRPYPLLCYAVVAQACKDYRHALQRCKRLPPAVAHHNSSSRVKQNYYDYCNAEYTIRECEYFFRNNLDMWCDYDGEWIISEIRRMVDDE